MDIDQTSPSIRIVRPREQATYLLNQQVMSAYGCVDRGVGVATCDGTTAVGAAVPTTTVGAATFSVTSTDLASNAATASAEYTVTYAIEDVNELGRAVRGRSPLAGVRITDAAGINRSSREIGLFARGLARADGTAVALAGRLEFDATIDGYVYTGDAGELTSGRYTLSFNVTGDPVLHTMQIRVK